MSKRNAVPTTGHKSPEMIAKTHNFSPRIKVTVINNKY